MILTHRDAMKQFSHLAKLRLSLACLRHDDQRARSLMTARINHQKQSAARRRSLVRQSELSSQSSFEIVAQLSQDLTEKQRKFTGTGDRGTFQKFHLADCSGNIRHVRLVNRLSAKCSHSCIFIGRIDTLRVLATSCTKL